MINRPTLTRIISAILLVLLWGLLIQSPLALFQASIGDSIWPGLLFVFLFIGQPVLLYYSLRTFLRTTKNLLFMAVGVSLISGLGFQRYKMLQIDRLLESEGVLTTGIITYAQTHSQRRKSTRWQVRATYRLENEEFLTPEYTDRTQALQLGDTVYVRYVLSDPAVSQIIH